MRPKLIIIELGEITAARRRNRQEASFKAFGSVLSHIAHDQVGDLDQVAAIRVRERDLRIGDGVARVLGRGDRRGW